MKRPSRTRLLVAAAALALLASLLAVGRLAAPRPAAPHARPAPAPAVVKLDVPGPVDDVARTIQPVAGRVVERLWIARDGQILRVDPHARRVTATVSGYRPRPDRPVRLAVTAAGALVATVAGDRLLVINPRTARVIATDPTPTRAPVAGTIDLDVFAVCCGADTRPGGGRLLRLGWGPGPRRTVALPGRPDAVGTGPSGVWVRGAGGSVWHLDGDSLRVLATVAIPGGLGAAPGGVAVTSGAVWVADPARATLWRIDPQRNRLVGRVAADGWDLAVGADQTVWASSGNRLLGLDRGVLRHTVTLQQLGSDRINAITAGPAALWVATPTGLFRVDLAALP